MDIMTQITDHLSWPTILFPGRRLMVPRSGARPLETLTTGSAPSPPTRCKSKLAIWGIQFTWNPQFGEFNLHGTLNLHHYTSSQSMFSYVLSGRHMFKALPIQSKNIPLLRHNMYDGSEEFWVVVKEKGKRQESASFEEIHEKNGKAWLSYMVRLCHFMIFYVHAWLFYMWWINMHTWLQALT